jgi:hypothetical protein
MNHFHDSFIIRDIKKFVLIKVFPYSKNQHVECPSQWPKNENEIEPKKPNSPRKHLYVLITNCVCIGCVCSQTSECKRYRSESKSRSNQLFFVGAGEEEERKVVWCGVV